MGIFVYFAKYRNPPREGVHRELHELPVPNITSIEWGSPDSRTISIFKYKIKEDILKFVYPSGISRRIKISWFLPIHVFVSCFRPLGL